MKNKILKEYEVQVTETFIKSWTIKAKSEEDAIIKAENKYQVCKSLTKDDYYNTEFDIIQDSYEDDGEYLSDMEYSQIRITTTKTQKELEDWLYETKFKNFTHVGVIENELQS